MWPTSASCSSAPTPTAPTHKGISWLILDMRSEGVEVRPMRTIDGESHFCEIFLDEVRVPVANLVGAENDGWRVTNVTLRFERGTAFAQHIITMRAQVRKLVALALARADPGRHAWDSDSLRVQRRSDRGLGRGALADDPDVHRRGRGDRGPGPDRIRGEAAVQRVEPGDRRARDAS